MENRSFSHWKKIILSGRTKLQEGITISGKCTPKILAVHTAMTKVIYCGVYVYVTTARYKAGGEQVEWNSSEICALFGK